jgi:hypothetical protein
MWKAIYNMCNGNILSLLFSCNVKNKRFLLSYFERNSLEKDFSWRKSLSAIEFSLWKKDDVVLYKGKIFSILFKNYLVGSISN